MKKIKKQVYKDKDKEPEKGKNTKKSYFSYIHTFILIGIGYTILLIGIFDWFRNIVVYY